MENKKGDKIKLLVENGKFVIFSIKFANSYMESM